MGVIEDEQEIHWQLHSREVDISIEVPIDMSIVDLFEVHPNGIQEIDYPVTMKNRTITLHDVPLDNDTPARIFVFASNESVRTQVEDNLIRP